MKKILWVALALSVAVFVCGCEKKSGTVENLYLSQEVDEQDNEGEGVVVEDWEDGGRVN